MTLFDDSQLFSSGTRGKRIFDLPDSDLMLIDNFFTKEESDYYYEALLNQTQWREYEMPMYDKVVTAPRLISWFEDGSEQEFTTDLATIRSRVENETQIKFNSVLLNLYRNGKDGVSWHSDRTDKSGKDPIIASVSFGETRIFRLRHKFRKDVPIVEIPLYHGSFLLMAGTTNSFWQHEIPKTAKDILPRINLTFRQVNRKP